ncbi:hypothetical protein AM233_06795 [Bacillus sp. FJAT-22058]|nr:hypothetical protein AM233_06795 [Bacillus sp. FJAT-22058]
MFETPAGKESPGEIPQIAKARTARGMRVPVEEISVHCTNLKTVGIVHLWTMPFKCVSFQMDRMNGEF